VELSVILGYFSDGESWSIAFASANPPPAGRRARAPAPPEVRHHAAASWIEDQAQRGDARTVQRTPILDAPESLPIGSMDPEPVPPKRRSLISPATGENIEPAARADPMLGRPRQGSVYCVLIPGIGSARKRHGGHQRHGPGMDPQIFAENSLDQLVDLSLRSTSQSHSSGSVGVPPGNRRLYPESKP
jgi:hypothetical protein